MYISSRDITPKRDYWMIHLQTLLQCVDKVIMNNQNIEVHYTS